MQFLETPEALEAHYGTPAAASTRKVADRLIPAYRIWLERARFCVFSTVGPEGTDASPRGDDGPVVRILDDRRVALPDWRGNDRIDSLRNIVRDPRVSLMFFIPGSTNVVRLNGRGRVTADADFCESFAGARGRAPRTVTVIDIDEVYFQCARALLRSRLWAGMDESAGLPTAGQILAEMTAGEVGGAAYDAEWPDRAARTMW